MTAQQLVNSEHLLCEDKDEICRPAGGAGTVGSGWAETAAGGLFTFADLFAEHSAYSSPAT